MSDIIHINKSYRILEKEFSKNLSNKEIEDVVEYGKKRLILKCMEELPASVLERFIPVHIFEKRNFTELNVKINIIDVPKNQPEVLTDKNKIAP